jgi:hypothetical protein
MIAFRILRGARALLIHSLSSSWANPPAILNSRGTYPAAASSGGMHFVLIERRSPLGSLSSKTACSYQSFASLVKKMSEPCPGSRTVLVLLLTAQVFRCFFAARHLARLEHEGLSGWHLR